MTPTPPDQYEKADLCERVSDLLADDNPVDAITAIAAAYEVDLYDLPEATDASA